MKTINFYTIAILLIAALALMGCNNKEEGKSSSQGSIAVISDSTMIDDDGDLRDSLNMAREYMNSLSTLVNEVSDGLNEIKEMERIVSTGSFNDETGDRKEQIRNDILLIKSSIQDRMNRLAELEEKLTRAEATRTYNIYNDSERKTMLETIANLKMQLTQQQEMIDDLTAKLNAAHTTIKNLNEKVDSLNTVNTHAIIEKQKAKEEAQKAQQEMIQLNNELNECFYAIGSKKELKDHKIIETGFLRKTKVMQNSNIMRSYFTKADKRTLNEINLHSNKAKVLTNHDKQSYSIDQTASGMKVLRIHNQDLFWQYTNYLVIQVD